MTYLRRVAAEVVDGFHRGVNLLLYGWPYPATLFPTMTVPADGVPRRLTPARPTEEH